MVYCGLLWLAGIYSLSVNDRDLESIYRNKSSALGLVAFGCNLIPILFSVSPATMPRPTVMSYDSRSSRVSSIADSSIGLIPKRPRPSPLGVGVRRESSTLDVCNFICMANSYSYLTVRYLAGRRRLHIPQELGLSLRYLKIRCVWFSISRVPYQSVVLQYTLSPDIRQLAADLPDNEPDDELHSPESQSKAVLQGLNFSNRGMLNIGCLLILCIGIVGLL